ncbi:MAG: pyrophosphokinase [Deltaproteobacteria bacterium]|nr:pyrophosphokinase [Deltaproteobacteria bacterium]
MQRVEEVAARAFAIERHGMQRYGEAPYVVHLAAVRAVLADAGIGGELLIAAWLHDVVEDTATTKDEVSARFGTSVAELVWAVTGVGLDRKARNLAAYAKMRALPAAVTLKLADRIANVEASVRSSPEMLAKYRSEWPAFSDALDGLGADALWQRLRASLGLDAR